MHRYHARRAARSKIATRFVSPPEPNSIGVVEKGQQLVAGKFLFSGLYLEDPSISIWDIAPDNHNVRDELQGCTWLDDLAAFGDETARLRAQDWVFDWIARFGNGRGEGWTPGITGRRVMRWINHGHLLLRGQDKDASAQFFQSLARQTLFLGRRWQASAPGLRRFEALAGTIYAGLSLEGLADQTGPALTALSDDCETHVDEGGAITTRNPEELLEILSLLNWTVQALAAAGQDVPAPITHAIERIAPVLRALRHADANLARFHGGGAGIDGRLDHALAASGVRDAPDNGLHMGFARLTGGRTTLIADAAAPPGGAASADGHASTLAFELTSGRRPLIVNCGSGARFGAKWRRASRATPSHSTTMIEGVSSSHLAHMRFGKELLTARPDVVRGNVIANAEGRRLEMSHNGYQASHGLTHGRILQMSVDGRSLDGDDILATLDDRDKAVFDRAKAQTGLRGIPFALRFHLHADVETSQDKNGQTIAMRLKSGEVWVLRHDGQAELRLLPSVYLQNGRLVPRPAQQVVLSGSAMAYATRVRWSLAKARDTPDVVRDFVQADPMEFDT